MFLVKFLFEPDNIIIVVVVVAVLIVIIVLILVRPIAPTKGLPHYRDMLLDGG